MVLRRLVNILQALAIVVAGMLPASASLAAAPAGHQSMVQMHVAHCPAMAGGHQKMPGHHENGTFHNCCAASCLGTAIAPSAIVEPVGHSPSLMTPASAKTFRSVLTEIATPPPRRA